MIKYSFPVIINKILLQIVSRNCKYVYPNNDEKYLKLVYRLCTGEQLDLENPRNFNQKMQWLKLYYRHPEFTRMVDKYEVHDIINKKLGEEYLFPILGVWEKFDEIDFNQLPDQFVLKTTHDSGTVVICHDKNTFDYHSAKEKLTKRLKMNYFWWGREYPYKNVKPRIIAEKYMVDEGGVELKDYKFFCFNGNPKILFYASGRFQQRRANFDFFDVSTRRRLDITALGYPHSNVDEINIINYDKMVDIASILSKGFPFIRIDLYNIKGKIYFGEYTFFHDSGFVPLYPEEWNNKLGDMIELPK